MAARAGGPAYSLSASGRTSSWRSWPGGASRARPAPPPLPGRHALGLGQLRRGVFPSPAVRVGIVSNGGACALLALHALQGAWSAWGGFAQLFMWAALAGTGAITAGLVAFGPCRAAVEPVASTEPA